MRRAKRGISGAPALVLIAVALLIGAVAGSALLAGCGSTRPAGSTAHGPGTSGSSTGVLGSNGTADRTTAASAPTSAAASTTALTATSAATSATTTAQPAVPVGEEARVGEWKVTVLSVTAPATELIAYANEFNGQPRPGFDYVLVTVQVANTGGGPADFSLDTLAAFVGNGGGEFGAPQARAETPQPIGDAGEVGPGGTASGDLVFEVRSTEMAGGRVALAPAASPAAAVFFATR